MAVFAAKRSISGESRRVGVSWPIQRQVVCFNPSETAQMSVFEGFVPIRQRGPSSGKYVFREAFVEAGENADLAEGLIARI